VYVRTRGVGHLRETAVALGVDGEGVTRFDESRQRTALVEGLAALMRDVLAR
jgi:hypothetical protein